MSEYEAKRPPSLWNGPRRLCSEKGRWRGRSRTKQSRRSGSKAMNTADFRIAEIYSTPFHTHSPMEPHAPSPCGRPGKADALRYVAGNLRRSETHRRTAGLGPENVRVVSLFLGGGFGSKGPTWSPAVICAMAARQSASSGEAGGASAPDVRPGGLPIGNSPDHFRGGIQRRKARGPDERNAFAHLDYG